MRRRFDEDGNVIGSHRMMFESIPDDYKVETIFTEDGKYIDLSHLGVFKLLKEKYSSLKLEPNDFGIEFQDEEWFNGEILCHMSLDYLNSAQALCERIIQERDPEVVSYYVIPCAFLCKHSIELFLKRCLLSKRITDFKGHRISTLWEKLEAQSIPNYEKITLFIKEVEQIDSDEIVLRYGLSNKLQLLPTKLTFNVVCLINNTKYLFNVLEEHIISKRIR